MLLKQPKATFNATHHAWPHCFPAGNMDTDGRRKAERGAIFQEVLQLRNMVNVKSRIKNLMGTGAALVALGAGFGMSSRPALATPATLGFYPSTDIYADKSFHLDVDTYRVQDFGGDGFDTVGLTYGIGDRDGAFGRSEVGFDYVLSGLGGNNFSNRVFLNGKTQIYNNADSGVRAVAGVWLFGKRASGAQNIGYLLGSKAFKWGRIHLGAAHAFRNQPAGVSETYLQLGYDKALTSKLSFAADFYSGRGPVSGIQPTFYYAVNDKASFGIGYFINREVAGAPNNDQLYLCFDYNFGGAPAQQEAQPVAPATGTPPANP